AGERVALEARHEAQHPRSEATGSRSDRERTDVEARLFDWRHGGGPVRSLPLAPRRRPGAVRRGQPGAQPGAARRLVRLQRRRRGRVGSVIAGELARRGVDVLVIESGGADTAPTIANPIVWFYNVGGPLDWSLPLAPSPATANRTIKMALGRVVGGGSSINAMVWARGMARDYDGWARDGAAGW